MISIGAAIPIIDRERGFNECRNLTSVTLPNSVTRIGYMAFWGCTHLTSITIPDSVTNTDHCAFIGCSRLTSITIPNRVANIGKYAFAGCTNLASITIPDGMTRIGHEAFAGCPNLKSVTIPNSVTNIGNMAFIGIKSITVDAGNPVYSSLNDMLCSKDGRTLFQGHDGDVTIPDSITRAAFFRCTSLTSIFIPASMEKIETSAFWGSTPIKTVYVDKGDVEHVRKLYPGKKDVQFVERP